MRNPVLNILTLIALLALCGVSAIVLNVFFNPDSALNPFPPPTLPVGIVLPSETPTPQKMPPTWTPGPGTIIPGNALAPSSTPLASPTGFILPTSTPTPTPTSTFTITTTAVPPTNTPSPSNTPISSGARTSTAIGNIFGTATSRVVNQTLTALPTNTPTPMVNISAAREKGGLASNVWQKKNNNPTFLWDVTPMMYEFYYYFGRNPDFGPAEDALLTPPESAGIRVAIRHDSKTVELNPLVEQSLTQRFVTECGAYYLRIKTRYAIKQSNTIVHADSAWTTIFTFKYDLTPPVAPLYASSGIRGALRGIQNISGSPSFNWSGVNGANGANEIWPEGDYIGHDINNDGVNEPYMCSGIKSYNVYFGPDPQGVTATKNVTSAAYKPASVKANTAYFVRVQSIDKLDNKSEWRTVALDETYDPEAVAFAEPLPDQAVFYYDTVRPNNIDLMPPPCAMSVPFTNDRSLTYSWSGGDDPVGFNTSVIWGYNVIWSTDLAAKPSFQKVNTFTPLLSTSGTYHLRVRAMDWAGNVSPDWRECIYRFDNVGPAGVTKVTESNSVKSNTYYTSLSDPVLHFSWSTAGLTDPGNSTNSSGILGTIFLYFGTDPDGVPVAVQPITDNTYDSAPVGGTGVYYLRIMTMDLVGNETVTTPFVLKFDNDAPTAPVITELHGVANNQIFPPNINLKDPNFSVTASDVGSGLKGYYYCWANGAACTPTKFVKTGSINPAAVAAGTVWYLEVYAVDNAGNIGPTSEFIFRYTP